MLGITIIQWPLNCTSCSTLSHLRRSDFVCPKILRIRGLCERTVQVVFRSVILARLLYASPVWWGFAAAQDKQKLYGFLRRISGLVSTPRIYPASMTYITKHNSMFRKVLHNSEHVYSPVSNTLHNLRKRTRDR